MCGLQGTEDGGDTYVRVAGDRAWWAHLCERHWGHSPVGTPVCGCWGQSPGSAGAHSQGRPAARPQAQPIHLPAGKDPAPVPGGCSVCIPLNSAPASWFFCLFTQRFRVPDPPEESVHRVPGCRTADGLAREVQLPCCTSFSARSHNPLSWVLRVAHNQQSSHR